MRDVPVNDDTAGVLTYDDEDDWDVDVECGRSNKKRRRLKRKGPRHG